MSRTEDPVGLSTGPTVTASEASPAEPGGRFLPSGEESGTAPDDRRFRPDVEGLRAVAVLLVVLFHAGIPHLTGGYVGVDVFFVISGFVITGLLLRERRDTGRTSILNFYARRCRRILPAATVVILATVIATYLLLGIVSGNNTADDGRWAAVFLANFHFEALGTNYLSSFRAPSPLQNYWSLSVEEQFYVVYPTLFLLIARVSVRAARGRRGVGTTGPGVSDRVPLAVALGVIIVLSYWLSVAQTAAHPAAAYFSPFTRACELALGGLVAVSTTWLRRLPTRGAAWLTWLGLGAIVFSAVAFTARTPYPGSLVAVPILGTAAVIAGGVPEPARGAETLLALRPFGWLGRRSYSLYLWHWPILILAAEQAGKSSLPIGVSLILVAVSIAVSSASYRVVENPIRHWRIPSPASVVMGIGAVLITFAVLSAAIAVNSSGSTHYRVAPGNAQAVEEQVARAAHLTKLPAHLEPTLAQAPKDYGGWLIPLRCAANEAQSREGLCLFGDPHGSRLMIVYGDSHAVMWLPALNGIAAAEHWRLIVLGKPFCPAELVTILPPAGFGAPGSRYAACDQWHQWAVGTINRLRPDLVIISQENYYSSPPTPSTPSGTFTSEAWRAGLVRLVESLDVPRSDIAMMGNLPLFRLSGPDCLAAHADDVQACSVSARIAFFPLDATERQTAPELGIRYVNVAPWFCSSVCTAVIGHYNVYVDQYHVTSTYARYLENVLSQSLGLKPVATTSQ